MPFNGFTDEQLLGNAPLVADKDAADDAPKGDFKGFSDEELMGGLEAKPSLASRAGHAVVNAGRAALGSAASLSKTAGLALAAPVVIGEKIKNAVTGSDDTSASDAALGTLVAPAQKVIDATAPKPDEKQDFLGKLGTAVGSLAPDLLAMTLSGGATAPEMIASRAPGLAEALTKAASHAFAASRPVMIKAATEKAQQVLDAGGSQQDAVKSGTAAAMLTWAQNVMPMSMEGSLARRIATGAPVGAVQGEAGRVAQNAVDPASMQQPFDAQQARISGILNSIMSGVFGHAAPHDAPTKEQLGYGEHAQQQGPTPSQLLASHAFANVDGDEGIQAQQQDLRGKIAASLAGMDEGERAKAVAAMSGGDDQLAQALHASSQDEALTKAGQSSVALNEDGTGLLHINEMIRKDAGLLDTGPDKTPSGVQAADAINEQIEHPAQPPEQLNEAGYVNEPVEQVQAQIDYVRAGKKPVAVFDPSNLHAVDLNGLEYGTVIDPHSGEQSIVAGRSSDDIAKIVERTQDVGLRQALGEALGYVDPTMTTDPKPGAVVVQQVDPHSGQIIKEEGVMPEQAGQVERVPGTDLKFTTPEQSLAQRAAQHESAPSKSESLSSGPPAASLQQTTPGFHGGTLPSPPGAGPVVSESTPRTDALVDRLNARNNLTGTDAIAAHSIREVKNPGGALSKMAKAVKWATGTDVVFVHTPDGALTRINGETFARIGGMADPQANTVYMNIDHATPLGVMGHELVHVLEAQHPEIYAALENAVFARMSVARAEQLKAHLEAAMRSEGQDQQHQHVAELRRELVAEAVGELAQQPKVWIETFNEIGKDRGAVQRFADSVTKLVQKLQRAFTREGYIVGAKDMQAVSDAFKQAYTSWARESLKSRAGEAVSPDKVFGPKAGVRPDQRIDIDRQQELASKIGQGHEPSPDELAEHPMVATQYMGLKGMIAEAERHQEEFGKRLNDIVSQLPGVKLKIGSIKAMPRAFEKVWGDYFGATDPKAFTKVKDLLRATFVVDDIARIGDLEKIIAKQFKGAKLKRNLYDPQSAKDKVGYHDALFNVTLNGMTVEVQANHPAMMAAKDEAHQYYKQHAQIERNLGDEEPTPVQRALLQTLEKRQRALYAPAYFRVLEDSAKARKSASEIGLPSSRSIVDEQREPSVVRQSPAESTSTPTPLSSQKEQSGGKEAGSGEGSSKRDIEDHSTAKPPAAVPADAQSHALPEGEHGTDFEDVPVNELPVSKLSLSTDVPQFKEGADKSGVVADSKLHGKFDRRLAPPIQVWERTDGSMEVISGRHRLDLARRSGETTIPAQVHREADGFTREKAQTLDIELNVKDGRGKVKDYVKYFQLLRLDRDQAREDGLLNTAIGRNAYEIASNGSENLVTAHANGHVSDEAAVSIARNAPGNEKLQDVGLRYAVDGKPINFAVSMMQMARLSGVGEHGHESGDLFGNDDSTLKRAEAIAREAVKQQNAVRKELAAIRGAAKAPELARKGGVEVKDAETTRKKIEELEGKLRDLENFHSNPELVEQLTKSAGLDVQRELHDEPQAEEPPLANDAAPEDGGGLLFSREWLKDAADGKPYLKPGKLMDDLPEPLRGVGALTKNVPLTISRDVAMKLLEGKKGTRPTMSPDEVLGLPDLLRKNIVAVLTGKDAEGSVVAVTDKVISTKEGKQPLVVAIHPSDNGPKGYIVSDIGGMREVSGRFNQLKTAHGRALDGMMKLMRDPQGNSRVGYLDVSKMEGWRDELAPIRSALITAAGEKPGGVKVPKGAAPVSRLSSSLRSEARVGSETQGPTKPTVSESYTSVKPGPRTLSLKPKAPPPELPMQRSMKGMSFPERLQALKDGKVSFDLESAIGRNDWAETYLLAKDPKQRAGFMRSIMDKLIERTSDGLVPVKRWIESLPLSPLLKQRLQGDLYRSSTVRSAKEKEVTDTFLQPMFKAVDAAARASDMTTDQVKSLAGDWMTAKYVPKANKYLITKDRAALAEAKRTGDKAKIAEAQKNLDDRIADVNAPAGTAKVRGVAGGMNDAEAAQIRAVAEGKIKPALLDEIAKPVYDMMRWRKAQDIESGKVTKAMTNSWPNDPEYVPLTGDPRATPEDSDIFHGTGNHLNQGADKAMKGRKNSLADNGIDAAVGATLKTVNFAAVQDFKRTLMRAYTEAKQQGHDIGLNVEKINGLMRTGDNVIMYRDAFDMPNGTQEHRGYAMTFDDPHIMDAIRKDNTEQLNRALSIIATPTRWYGKAVTQLVVTFAPINMVRDVWERSELLRTRTLFNKDGAQVDVNKAARAAIADTINPDLWKATFDKSFKTGKASPVRGDLEEMIRLGGNSVWGAYVARQAGQLDAELRRSGQLMGSKMLRTGADKLSHGIEGYNATFEMIAPLSIYRALKAQGMDPKDAAAATLDLMNFRKRGTMMPAVKAFYVFAQPNATSAYNLMQYLSTRTGQKRFAAQVLVGSMLYAMLKSMWGSGVGKDDKDDDEVGNRLDNLSNYTVERNIPIPIGDKLVKVPVGFGPPQLAWAVSGILNRWASGRYSTTDALGEVSKDWVKSMAPVSPSDIEISKRPADFFISTITPTVLKPIFNIYADQTSMGGPLTPHNKDANKLKSVQANRTTAQAYSDVAQEIQQWTGIDVYPDQIKALSDGYLIGPLQQIVNAFIDNPGRAQRGEPEHMPLLSSLVDNVNDRQMINSIYYRVRGDLEDAHRQYATAPQDHPELAEQEQAYQRFNMAEKPTQQARNGLKKMAPNMDPDALAERTQAIEEASDRAHMAVLKAYFGSK